MGAKEARNHHYIPQCYLAGFTKGGGKKSKLVVLSLKDQRYFETIPRNVGARRDFNRVDVAPLPPNSVESAYGIFEMHIADAIRHVVSTRQLCEPHRGWIMFLIALLAARRPERRAQLDRFFEDLSKMIMEAVLRDKETWEAQVAAMRRDGVSLPVTNYEVLKDFIDRGEFTVSAPREKHVGLELAVVPELASLLGQRSWSIALTTPEMCLVTSDNPIDLAWDEPDSAPRMLRSSPGFGLRNTQVGFPLTSQIALIGRFDETIPKLGEMPPELAATFNTKAILLAHNQAYSPTRHFPYVAQHSNAVRTDGHFFAHWTWPSSA